MNAINEIINLQNQAPEKNLQSLCNEMFVQATNKWWN